MSNKSEIKSIQSQISGLSETIIDGNQQIQKDKATLLQLEIDVAKAHADLDQACNFVDPNLERLAALESNQELESLAKQLELELENELQANLEKERKLLSLETNIESLQLKLPIAEATAKQALELSKSKNPQVEELAKWFKLANQLIAAENDIKSINMLSDTKLEIVYSFEENHEQQLLLKLKPDPDTNEGCLVDAKIPGSDIAIHDILSASKDHLKMDSALQFVIYNVHARLRNNYLLKLEIEAMNKNGPIISLDTETNDCIYTSDKSTRTFVISVDTSYPLSGNMGLKIVGIEPINAPDEISKLQVFEFDIE
jgi:hypothetical protein